MFQITAEQHLGFRWSPALRPGSQIIVLRVPEQMYDPVTQLVGLNFHVIDVPTQVTHEKRQVGGKP